MSTAPEGKETSDMTPPRFADYILIAGVVLTGSSGRNQGEDICSSFGGFCGSVKCLPVNDNETFTCDCGKEHYFDATSKRCVHRASCQIIECQLSSCVDEDGRREATCVCDGHPDMTSDCQVDPAFKDQCTANGGTVRMTSDEGRSVPKCECPTGTIQLANGTCKSIACLLPYLTCKEICSNEKLREDQRCCQKWSKDRCNEPPQSGTFCEPGTIWNDTDKSCTNACAASKSGPVCEHGCTYIDIMAPAYKCKCHDDELVSPDGLDCQVKTQCSNHDIEICESEGRLCSIENGKVRCKCPENTIGRVAYCSGTCSSEKERDCASLLSSCMVQKNTETCTCHHPLRWDADSRQCVLDKQYKYVVFFKRRDFQGLSSSREQCSGPIHDEVVNSAMKTLYGHQLQVARILNCSEVTNVELTFNEDPSTAVLQRIRLCESKSQTCFFPPSLLIERGSVSGPVAIDLCQSYLEKLDVVSNATYRCSNLSHGRYLIDCSTGKNKKIIHSGFLEIRLCSAADGEEQDSSAKFDYKTTITYSAIAVLVIVCIVLFLVLHFRRRFCFYRLPVVDTEYDSVEFRGKENLAEGGEPTIDLLEQRCDTDTARKQNRANEAALVGT